MKVKEVIAVLSACDPEFEVSIEQIFKEHKSIDLRSIEVLNGCVYLKDHHVRISQASAFTSFDGKEYSASALPEKYTKVR